MMKQYHQKKMYIQILIISLLLFLPYPSVAVGTSQIGVICTKDDGSECITGTCEQKKGTDIKYCVCTASAGNGAEGAEQCAARYNDIDPNAGSWQCEQGIGGTYDLNYCQNSQTDISQAPAGSTGGSSWWEYLTDTTAAVQLSSEELNKLLKKPSLRINIPGVSFTDPNSLARRVEDGGTFIYFPYIGEYIAPVYKYGVVAVGVFAVIMIIFAGFIWTTSGGSSERINEAKKRIVQAIIGLLIATTSYSLLYLINPELVDFRNLRVQVLAGTPLTDIEDVDFSTGKASSSGEFENLSQAQSKTGPSADTQSSSCETKPSQTSGIGETTYLGQLDCNSTKERKLTDIKNIILHDGGSTVGGTVKNWVQRCQQNSSDCVASHYFIDRKGTIYQLLDEKKVGYHTPGWNDATIGIDLATVGPADRSTYSCLLCKKTGSCKSYTGKPRTADKTDKQTAIADCSKGFQDAQYVALSKLLDSILGRIGKSRNTSTILGHCNSAGNHGDPVGFDWTKLNLSTPNPAPRCYFEPSYSQKLLEDATKLFGQ